MFEDHVFKEIETHVDRFMTEIEELIPENPTDYQLEFIGSMVSVKLRAKYMR